MRVSSVFSEVKSNPPRSRRLPGALTGSLHLRLLKSSAFTSRTLHRPPPPRTRTAQPYPAHCPAVPHPASPFPPAFPRTSHNRTHHVLCYHQVHPTGPAAGCRKLVHSSNASLACPSPHTRAPAIACPPPHARARTLYLRNPICHPRAPAGRTARTIPHVFPICLCRPAVRLYPAHA